MSHFNRLASSIIRGKWLLDPRFVVAYGPMIADYLNGDKVSFFGDDDEDPYLGATFFTPSGLQVKIEKDEVKNKNIFSNAPAGSVAVIPVHGTIMHDDGACGEVGTRTMSSWVRDALGADNITGIMYHVNSPGGQVDGTGDFSRLIKQGRRLKSSKTFTDGLMASAGYWIGSSTDEVFASFDTVEIGSIGTCISFMDNSAKMKEWGLVKHYINADSSPDKNQDFIKALDGDYSGLKVNILNPTNDIFLNTVKENRTGKLQLKEVTIDNKQYFEPLTGKIYLAQSAISMGLIDGVKSFEEVIDHTASAGYNGGSRNANHQKFFNMSLFNKNPKLTSLSAKIRGGAKASTEELDEVNTELNANGETGLVILEQSAVQGLESELATANGTIATLNTTVSTLTTERDKYKADAEKYGAQPGGEPSVPNPSGNAPESQPTDTQTEVEPWNDPNAEFNQIIDRGRTSGFKK